MRSIKLEDLPQYTYEDYLNWEDRWELIYGVPYAMAPAPSIKHQSISSKIAKALLEVFENCHQCQVLMPIDWKISEDTIVQPDNSVICHSPENENYIKKAPKIIFEILSKSTSKKDLGLKYNLYEKEGVEYYIIVDPVKERATVHKLIDNKYKQVLETREEKFTFDVKECEEKQEFKFSEIW